MGRARQAAAAAIVFAVAAAWPAAAHEQRQVGAYQLTVGWAHEPAYTGVENAVQVFVKDAKGNPVDDLGDPPTLRLNISTGSLTSDPLELKASFDPDTGFGTHGEFDAAVIPTAPGDYTFHLTGSINGQAVDERFTSSDKTFDPVKDPTEAEFPAKPPTAGQLAANVGRLNARVAAARAKADSAKALSTVAVALAVVFGGLGIAFGLTARRRA
jgi:hypothetical protein